MYYSDINECTENQHDCDRAGGQCINTQGTYLCICISGYAGNGVNCTGKKCLFKVTCCISCVGWCSQVWIMIAT